MAMPAWYEQIKSMSLEDEKRMPLFASLKRLREHVENDHGGKPEDYLDDVLGYHETHYSDCNLREVINNAARGDVST